MVEVPVKPGECNFVDLDKDTQRHEVLAILKQYKFLCDRAIAAASGLPVHIVTARRDELVRVGLVCCAFKAKSPFSGVRVKHWGVTR